MEEKEEKTTLGIPEIELLAPGHRACAGCGSILAMRHALKAATEKSIVVSATGCMEVVSTPYPQTAWRVPWIHVAFENAAAVASGIDRALRQLGTRSQINLLAIGGDGGTFDIGLQALSGAAERRDKFTYICYDNNGYMNCLSTDSLIMTEGGLRRITDIKKGDMIYAFDQREHMLVLKKCSGVYNNGIKKVYELSTFHHSIKATSNHPFLTLKRQGRGKEGYFIWKTLGELKRGDEIITIKKLKAGSSFKFSPIKLSKKGDYKVNKINVLEIPEKSSQQLLEFLGLYVGDGWVRANRAEVGFALPLNSKGRERLIKLYKAIFGKEKVYQKKDYIYLYSINLARFIDSLGFGKGARYKTVPDWIFTLPQEEKEAFVNGLMLSDGYTIGQSSRYVSSSIDLLKSLRLLLQTMDYRVGKIHQQKKLKGTFCVYRRLLEDSTYGYICFSKMNRVNIKKYLSQTKQRDFLVANEHFHTEKITSIKYTGEEPTLDLRVDDEHNFIADGIVVHNTGAQRSGATPKYASTTTSPAGSRIHGKTEYPKNLPFIMASHGCYVATANIAFPKDYIDKIRKSFSFEGVSYIQVFTPCPTGWKTPSETAVELSKLAFQTNVTPLFEIENGVLAINRKPDDQRSVAEYLKQQGRFKHMNEQEIAEVQDFINKQWDRLNKLHESKMQLF